MAKVMVKRIFADVEACVDRTPGEVFECSDDRAKHILSVLGNDYVDVELCEADEKPKRPRSRKKAE